MSRVLGSRIGLQLAAIALLGALLMRSGFAEDAGSVVHGDGKAATSAQSNAGRAPSGENAGGGAATPEAHAPRGDDGNAHQGGPPASDAAVKDASPSAPGAKDVGAIEAGVAPSRRLDKKNRIGEGRSAIESAAARNLHPRMLSIPRQPHPLARNAIGIPTPQRNEAERIDNAHANALAGPHDTPAGTAVTPGAFGHLTRIESGVGHHIPNPNPLAMPQAPNRGAISGTGISQHNSGPPQIGGPKAAAAGVNGTTIRPKH
jgi:hypothetical protein